MPASLLTCLSLIAWALPAASDIPRCDRDGNIEASSSLGGPVAPYCLPLDYNKDIIPHTDGPLKIKVK